MKLVRIRLQNFQSFGPDPADITFEAVTYLLGPNGAGKTAVLQALVRLFGTDRTARRVKRSDFHAYVDEEGNEVVTENLHIEAEFKFDELADGMDAEESSVPAFFAHMRLETAQDVPIMRVRLTANLTPDGDVDEKLQYVVNADEIGTALSLIDMPLAERNMIHIHYLPAKRDPSEQITFEASSLFGRVLRAANWAEDKDVIAGLADEINKVLRSNAAVSGVDAQLAKHWAMLHRGTYFKTPEISFAGSELEKVLRQVTLSFLPSPDARSVHFNRLSDGQQSLLYISLVLAIQAIGRDVVTNKSTTFDLEKLRVPAFSLLAIEEPENSLSSHYLGRVLNAIREFSSHHDAQSVIATHSTSILRRVNPEHIRYLRLNPTRRTVVKTIVLPDESSDAHKFVREAVQAFPELYFSRFVILGEGDSEEIVIPKLLDAAGVADDDTSISVVPLGGRHVNHFWRLLNGLDIPYLTLLDLDLGRHGGGWGRLKYACEQLRQLGVGNGITPEYIDRLPKWDSEKQLLTSDFGKALLPYLENHGVFYSEPLDLDFALLEAFPEAYGISDLLVEDPNEAQISAVLGKSHGDVGQYSQSRKKLFSHYHRKFKLRSKPVAHLEALAHLDLTTREGDMPASIQRLIGAVKIRIEALPE